MDVIAKDPQRTFLIVMLASIGMIGVALFMEHYLELKPCILCYMQRGAVIIVGVLAAIGYMLDPSKLRTYRFLVSLILVFAIAGALLAIRQLYLQGLPQDLVPNCMPDIDYLFATLPFLEVLILAFTGDGNCAEVLWTFLGISIPGWVLIALSLISLYCLFIIVKAHEIHSHK
tara:strand:+ start:4305 stop:4823 length:519 start_codon:yes stop_codon:yes gene_type:complete